MATTTVPENSVTDNKAMTPSHKGLRTCSCCHSSAAHAEKTTTTSQILPTNKKLDFMSNAAVAKVIHNFLIPLLCLIFFDRIKMHFTGQEFHMSTAVAYLSVVALVFFFFLSIDRKRLFKVSKEVLLPMALLFGLSTWLFGLYVQSIFMIFILIYFLGKFIFPWIKENKSFVPEGFSFIFVFDFIGGIMNIISRIVNKPFILNYKNHIFFLSYGLCQGLGAFLTAIYFKYYLLAAIPLDKLNAFIILSTIPAIIGNRIAGLIAQLFVEKLSFFEAIRKVRFIVWGFIAGYVLAIFFFANLWNISSLYFFDGFTAAMLLSHAVSRLGCLFYGCCHGDMSSNNTSLCYTHPNTKPIWKNGLKKVYVFPTPLFSSFYGWLLFFLLFMLRVQFELPVGLTTALGCFGFGFFRYIEEWYRIQSGAEKNSLSPGQQYSLFMMFCGILVAMLCINPSITYSCASLTNIDSLFTLKEMAMPVLILISLTLLYSYHKDQVGSWGN